MHYKIILTFLHLACFVIGTSQAIDETIAVKVLEDRSKSSGIVLVSVPAGTFSMGSPVSELKRMDHEKQHDVTITKGFFIGRDEVTIGQFEAVIGAEFPDKSKLLRQVTKDSSIMRVNWFEAIDFCNKLSEADGLKPFYRVLDIGKKLPSIELIDGADGYCLPSEAQWEYACRGSTTTAYSFGDDIDHDKVQYFQIQRDFWRVRRADQGELNAFGVRNMHGNVEEWCWDWYGDYPTAEVIDPIGPEVGERRVIRGGDWLGPKEVCRSASRNSKEPWLTNPSIGFRIAKPL